MLNIARISTECKADGFIIRRDLQYRGSQIMCIAYAAWDSMYLLVKITSKDISPRFLTCIITKNQIFPELLHILMVMEAEFALLYVEQAKSGSIKPLYEFGGG